MRRLGTWIFLSAAALAPQAPAQTTLTVPPWRATSEGSGAGILPFGYNRVRLTQVVSRTMLKGLGGSALVKEIDYRGDGKIAGTMSRPASVSWTVRMANLAVFPLHPTPRFPDTTGLTTVFKPRTVNWPALAAPAVPPAPWNVRFPLDVPFSYKGGSLVVDHYSYDLKTGRIYTYACDWEVSSPGTGGKVVPFGAGCPSGANRATGYAPAPGGGSLALFLHGAPPGGTALACLGTTASTWGGLLLPFSLSGVGLPGCFLYTEIVTMLPVKVGLSGMGETFLPVPGSPELLGGRLRAQFLVLQDPRVNPALPLTASEGLDIRLGSRMGGRRPAMYVIQGVNFQARTKWGFLFEGEGPVFRLKT